MKYFFPGQGYTLPTGTALPPYESVTIYDVAGYLVDEPNVVAFANACKLQMHDYVTTNDVPNYGAVVFAAMTPLETANNTAVPKAPPPPKPVRVKYVGITPSADTKKFLEEEFADSVSHPSIVIRLVGQGVRESDLSANDKELRIFVHSTIQYEANCDHFRSPANMMFGKKADTSVCFQQTDGKGRAIYTKEGLQVAWVYDNNNIFVLINPNDTAVPGANANLLVPILRETMVEVEYGTSHILNMMQATLDAQIASLKAQVADLGSKREKLALELTTTNTNHRLLSNALSKIGLPDSMRTKIDEECEAIKRNKKVVKLDFFPSGLLIRTKNLYCKNPDDGLIYDIGEFLIRIHLTTQNEPVRHAFAFWNLTRKVKGYSEYGMHAPHVFPSGAPCMGNMTEIYPDLVANHELASLVDLAIQYLESVNTSDPAGKYIVKFPVKKEETATKEEPKKKGKKKAQPEERVATPAEAVPATPITEGAF